LNPFEELEDKRSVIINVLMYTFSFVSIVIFGPRYFYEKDLFSICMLVLAAGAMVYVMYRSTKFILKWIFGYGFKK
jgi:hypothetical protein